MQAIIVIVTLVILGMAILLVMRAARRSLGKTTSRGTAMSSPGMFIDASQSVNQPHHHQQHQQTPPIHHHTPTVHHTPPPPTHH